MPVISFADYPAWLTVAGSSISGTPSYMAGDTSFVVIASDGELADTLTVQLHVVQVSGIGDIDRMPAQGISVPAGSYNLYGGPATRNGIGIILVRDADGNLVKRLRLE